jgi:hypothetical protein
MLCFLQVFLNLAEHLSVLLSEGLALFLALLSNIE